MAPSMRMVVTLCSFDPALKKRMFRMRYQNGNSKTTHFVEAYDISEVKLQSIAMSARRGLWRSVAMVKMPKILVERDFDNKNAIWLGIPKDSAFYHFLMEGEFDNADKELYKKVMGIRKEAEGFDGHCKGKS